MELVVKGVPINYEVLGTGRPVVILHGSPIDHRSMKASLEPIFEPREGWCRIYLDLPGHGKTPGPDWIKNNDQMVELIIDFVSATIPGQSFALVGESYGGYLARGIVHHQPGDVDGLFLWTPASYPRSERKRPAPAVRVKEDRIASGVTSKAEREIFSILVVQSTEAMDFARVHMVPGWEIADQEFIARVVDTKFSFDLGSQKFERPTLILCGRQDSVVGYQEAYDSLGNYPMGTILVADGAGHVLGLTEELRLFRASVNSWLESLERMLS